MGGAPASTGQGSSRHLASEAVRLDESAAALRSVPLFAGLSDKELKAVARDVKEERFGPGEDLVVEGQQGGPFFLIIDGEASLIVNGRVRKKLGRGDYFGEMALIDRQPRSATVRTETDVRVLTATSWNFLAMLEENWAVTRKILAELSRRIRVLDKTLDS